MSPKPVIVISATRFFQGGTLVIVNECLKFLSAAHSATHSIKALVYNKALYDSIPGIEWVEFPNARKSIFNRLYDEYIQFNRLSKKWNPVLWLSLQDSTPRVKATVRAVYFHNPLLLKPPTLRLWKEQPRLEVLRWLYKYVYTRGIAHNDFIIAQQVVIADHLWRTFHLPKEKIRVFPPTAYLLKRERREQTRHESKVPDIAGTETPYTFIFPATSFYYKNHALLLSACRILKEQAIDFRVWLTIDGTENGHVKKLVKFAKRELPQIVFLGFLKREVLFDYYAKANCLVFPSLLESWGLPLTEFAAYGKPILCADLPYGRSTLSSVNYRRVAYFDPVDERELAEKMASAIQGNLIFDQNDTPVGKAFRQMCDWTDCFNELLRHSARP